MPHTNVHRPRVPDGYRDRLRSLANRLECGATEQQLYRQHAGDDFALVHATIDGERLMLEIADELRKLRR